MSLSLVLFCRSWELFPEVTEIRALRWLIKTVGIQHDIVDVTTASQDGFCWEGDSVGTLQEEFPGLLTPVGKEMVLIQIIAPTDFLQCLVNSGEEKGFPHS